MTTAIAALIGLATLAAAIWVANDAARRGRTWFGWMVLVWLTSLIGAAVWLIVRRRWPVVNPPPTAVQMVGRGAALLLLLMFSVLLQIVLVAFVFQFARIEGHAMEPALQDGRRVLVNKLVYRFEEPRRGDVVMLYYPLNPDKSFVKRLIAEEGDTVRIVDGKVTVNDIPLKDDEYVPPAFRSHDDWGPQIVPQGYYFVLGDHRNNSSDSRHWGMVPKRYILGRITP
jgi:signal peptidase I